jgi:hypothetical protein
MKVCLTVEIKTPTTIQITNLTSTLLPNLQNSIRNDLIDNYIKGDLRKLKSITDIYNNYDNLLREDIINNIFQSKIYNDDSKKITKKLLKNKYKLDEHLITLNETDRTIVGLLFHENIVDIFNKNNNLKNIDIYTTILDNICYADYMDRITFQKQIWCFNEMSSLIKIFYNNNILHDNVENIKYNSNEVRFTKILTKYSTEYNNLLFINNLCISLSLEKKDLFTLFLHLKKTLSEEEIYEFCEQYNISKLDVNRLYRYLNIYTQDITLEESNNIEEEST